MRLIEMRESNKNEKEMVAEKIEKIVEEACKKETNHFGYGYWSHHITAVIKNAKLLAKKLNADIEIVEMAAILHDYAAAYDSEKFYQNHHIIGAEMAGILLQNHKFPRNKIDKVMDCIYSHRGTVILPKKSLEAKIVASADAMAHFDNVDSFLYMVYIHKKMSIDEGTRFTLDKLERSWKKLMPEAKEIVAEKYKAIKIALE